MAPTKGRITLEKQWHHISQPYALQVLILLLLLLLILLIITCLLILFTGTR